MYTKQCVKCGRVVDVIRPAAERETPEPCQQDGCDGDILRQGLEGHGITAENWKRWWRGIPARQRFA